MPSGEGTDYCAVRELSVVRTCGRVIAVLDHRAIGAGA